MDDMQWGAILPRFPGSPTIVPHSYPTGESLLLHPTNVFKVKHSRRAFQTFPLPMKGSSVKGERYHAFLIFTSLQTLWFCSVPQSTESHPARSWGYSPLPFLENVRIKRALPWGHWLGEESGLAGRIRARSNGRRTWEVRKSTISLCIIHSISNHNPDKRRFSVP
jgi:hypothetical protein